MIRPLNRCVACKGIEMEGAYTAFCVLCGPQKNTIGPVADSEEEAKKTAEEKGWKFKERARLQDEDPKGRKVLQGICPECYAELK